MKRGDVVLVAPSGDYGKPRPAVLIQSDALIGSDSVLIALMTTDLIEASLYRQTVLPDALNGLRMPSQIMIEKIMAFPRLKCRDPIGQLDQKSLAALDQKLALIIGLADPRQ